MFFATGVRCLYYSECDVKKCRELEKEILSAHKNIKKFVISKTALCRDINAYTLGKVGGVLLCGAFHSMERLTAEILYRFLDDVCTKAEQDEVFAKSIKSTGLTIVPMINPDGVEISVNGVCTAHKYSELVSESLCVAQLPHTKWQANARGVDINHNFDAGYEKVKEKEKKIGITAPSPTRYGGKYAESEKETKALCDLCRQYEFLVAVALHTQGREIYYDFGENTPKESLSMANAMSALSGYKVSHPSDIAVGGGFKDWFIERFCRPAFTLEVGLGENPLDPRVAVTEYEKVSKMLWYIVEYATKNAP